jgi:lipid-A-disaccharide synthase
MVAGEASGDALGARVLAALAEHFDELVIEGIGGPQMQAQGMQSLFTMERLSVMGFVDPLKRLPELLTIRRALRRHFVARPPDIFLGIDSPDFNLRLEQQLRRSGVLTAHLVSPSVWAWRRRRIRKIRRSVDLMLCLFPFETAIYRDHGVPVRYVGHPLANEVCPVPDPGPSRQRLGLEAPAGLLALLPGSREAEVRLLAPRFLEAARLLREQNPLLSFLIPAASEDRMAQLREILGDYPDLSVMLVMGQSREAMAAADAVMVASGTATLEAALIGRPMVVAYRMGRLTWQLLSRLVNTPYAALPNILAGRELVPELIQEDAHARALAAAMIPLLAGGPEKASQMDGFGQMRDRLRVNSPGASAEALLELMAGRRKDRG